MRISDWSSDVCSSDLKERPLAHRAVNPVGIVDGFTFGLLFVLAVLNLSQLGTFRHNPGLLDAARGNPGPLAADGQNTALKFRRSDRSFERHDIPVTNFSGRPLDRKSTRLNSSH